jgi:hypothetical protein
LENRVVRKGLLDVLCWFCRHIVEPASAIKCLISIVGG